MAYIDMVDRIGGAVAKMPRDLAFTLVSRAWADVRRQNLWSFLLFESNWTSPSPINVGTVATVQGTNTVTFNATAMAALNAVVFGPPTPLIARQFRIGVGTIYNIWAYNLVTGVATLDRPYQEASAAASGYLVYQCYYPAPVPDFWVWMSVVDRLNFNPLIHTKTRAWLDQRDPQRSQALTYIPAYVVPFAYDQNPASATYGTMLFELWGSPQFPLTWQLYGVRKGIDLVNDTDTLPIGIGEDVVEALAKKYAYEWGEANKGDQPRAVGSDFKFLMGETSRDYKRLYREYRLQDWALVKNFGSRLRRRWTWPSLNGWYNSISGSASPGAPW